MDAIASRRVDSLHGLRNDRQHDGVNKMTENEIRQTVSDELVRDVLRERRSERNWRLVKRSLMVASGVVCFAMYLYSYSKQMGWTWMPNSAVTGVVHVDGEIASGNVASADKIVPLLKSAFESEHVKAVVLSIDSPGGAPVEAERIYQAIKTFKKKNPKPVIAVINNVGASAAYMVALHTDKIYAAHYSLVGSVGAVLTGWDFHKALEKLQISQRVYASGHLKSMLNPFIPMTPEAERKAQELVQKMGERFKAEVVAARGKKLSGNVDYATGEAWDGVQAKELGLVDEVSTLDAVTASLGHPVHDFGPQAAIGASWLNGMTSVFESAARLLEAMR